MNHPNPEAEGLHEDAPCPHRPDAAWIRQANGCAPLPEIPLEASFINVSVPPDYNIHGVVARILMQAGLRVRIERDSLVLNIVGDVLTRENYPALVGAVRNMGITDERISFS